jgi:hypothetical protein
MRSRHWKLVAVVVFVGVMLCAAAYVAQAAKTGESERKVTAAEVPEAALAALKKLARRAEITEFAEEIELGSTFYEGSWKNRSGANVDVLVTKTGDLVEIEEEIPAKRVPRAVLRAARKAAGKDAELACEKKTMILYEIKFQKDDGRHELLLTPDGRHVEEEVEKGKTEDEGDGDGDDDKQSTKANSNDKGDDDEDDDDEGDDEDEDDEDDEDEDEDADDEEDDDVDDDEDEEEDDDDVDDDDEDEDDEDEDDEDEDD